MHAGTHGLGRDPRPSSRRHTAHAGGCFVPSLHAVERATASGIVAAAGAPVILRDVPARVAIDGALHTWPSYSRTLQHVVIDHRLDHDLRTIDVPVQILVGSDDHVSTPDTIRGALTRTARDDIDLRVIDGDDHHLALHHPGLVAAAVDFAVTAATRSSHRHG